MKHVIAIVPARESLEAETEKNLVHYDGPGIIGSHTLCGHTDLVTWRWADTNKRVNCRGCLGTRDHVMGRRRKSLSSGEQGHE